jgi:hypothetical protein
MGLSRRRLAGLLFRKMNKAGCLKILIINDHNGYGFNLPPNQTGFVKLIDEICNCIKNNFHTNCFMDSPNMKEKIDGMVVQEIQTAGVKPEAFPDLRDLGELQKWVSALQDRSGFHNAIKKEMDEQLGIHKKTLFYKNSLHVRGVFATGVLAVAGVAATSMLIYQIGFVVSGLISADGGLNTLKQSSIEEKRCIRNLKVDIEAAEIKMEKAIDKLQKAMEEFSDLAEAVDVMLVCEKVGELAPVGVPDYYG